MAARWVVLPASYSMLFSFLEVRTHPEARQVNEASTVCTSCEVQNIENVCLFQLCLWSGISLCLAGLKEEGISGEYNF